MKYLLFFSMALTSLAAFASTKPKSFAELEQEIQAQSFAPKAGRGAGPSGNSASIQQKINAQQNGSSAVRAVQGNTASAPASNNTTSTAAAFAAAFDKKLRDMEARLYNYVDKVLPKPSEPDSDDEDDDSIKATATMIRKDKDFGAAAW